MNGLWIKKDIFHYKNIKNDKNKITYIQLIRITINNNNDDNIAISELNVLLT